MTLFLLNCKMITRLRGDERLRKQFNQFPSGHVIKGKQLCDKPDCYKEFKWVYQNGGEKYEVVELYKRKDDEEFLMIIDKDTLDTKCRCSHCGRMNFFKADFE